MDGWPGAVVVGASSKATGGVKGIAIGHTVYANGQDAVAIGSNSNAQTQSVAVGRLANAAANGVAVGNTAIVRKDNAIAIGAEAEAAGLNSTSISQGAKAVGAYSVAVGPEANVLRPRIMVLHLGQMHL